ncbi:hypothetical protein PYEL_30690 [Pseudomonas sp. URMO17WK12:I11]|nr:hypothetical protein PYEL_30690 [Pseudomonas sp. URMO17WK12:I11]
MQGMLQSQSPLIPPHPISRDRAQVSLGLALGECNPLILLGLCSDVIVHPAWQV